eukprot:TRINITY_DN317_c0_g1_i1.p1 TRINITY_DN317_c0_g1~~TRINITY_DN317_c0_g1_i1.p1  ORF type:complete len:392 (+),score=106.29 TRINITY_DN317_c0_g1_i1:1266-2441(+)
MDTSDPLSPQDFELLKNRISELESENDGLRKDGNNYKQEIIEVRKELEGAQQKLAEIQNEYDAEKRRQSHDIWKKFRMKLPSRKLDDEKESKAEPKPEIDTDKLRNDLLGGENVAGLGKGKVARASTSRISHITNQQLRPIKEAGELKFTEDVRQIRKSLLQGAAERKARNEEHENFLKQLLGHQENLLRRTEMAEAGQDDPNTILRLLEENKKQAQETDLVVEKLQEYYDENEQLRLEAQERNAEVENLYASVQAKEKQLEEMRAEIFDLEEQVKSVDVYENMAQETLMNLTSEKRHLSPVAHDVEDSKSLWGLMRNKLSEKRAGKDLVQAQNALTKKNDLLHNIFANRDYLRATTTRYLEEEEKEVKKGHFGTMMDIYEDDFQEKEVTE